MKTRLLLAILLFAGAANAQVIRCYTDENDARLRSEHPEMETEAQFEQWLNQEITERTNNPNARIVGGVYQIPVVVHVIHSGESVGTGSNVSYAAIKSQIDVLNEDFRKIMYSNGYNTNPVGADTEIEFVLAKRRPDGSAFPSEDGVNRINRSSAGFTAPPYTTSYIDATIKTYTYNNGTATATRGWTPDKYLNIWLCNISGNILGYAQFPQSPLGGMGCGVATTATDGVVFLYSSIGKSSVTGVYNTPYNEGRTATHEIGHWLGLRHIWGDASGCTGNDYCNDTPVANAANFGCPTGTNSCPSNPGDDMIENYMDYTDDICMNIFTYDQKTRMRTVLESTPLRQSLINSDACVAPNTNDVSVIDITSPVGDNCAGSITPKVVIKNRGTSALTSAKIIYQIDNGALTTFDYSGSLASGATATVSLSAFTSYLGVHTFKAYTTLPNGVTDPAPERDTVQISFMVSKGLNAPYTQDFEGDVFPPDLKWVVDNANVDCYEWIGGSATSITGTLDNNAALFPGFGNTSGSTDNLVSPIFILPCNASAASIQFDVAYRRRNTTASNYERLYVEISEDCGATWNATPIYDKTGTALQVLTTTLTSYYIPAGTTDWRTETVNLASFIGASSKNIKFRFRAVAANGNNIYIDNFKYNATFPAEITVKENSVEILDGGGIDFGLVNVGGTSTKTFTVSNDGSSALTLTLPASVTGTNFTIVNDQLTASIAAGTSKTFDVTFAPTAATAYAETFSLTNSDCDEGVYDFLLIGTGNVSAPVANFYANMTQTCTGADIQFTSTSTNATSYSWNFGTNAVPQTSTAANPVVHFTTNGAHDVTLTATSIYGNDVETKTSYITTLNTVSGSLPFNEGFAAAGLPANWSVVNNNSSTTWTRSATVGLAPTAGNSYMFNNFAVNDYDDDQLRMPGLNFTNYASTQLTFDVAYAPRSTTAFDGLEVLVSTDCGRSFTSVYVKSNTVLATRTATTSAFTPTATQWRTETVNLSSFVGNNNVIVAFKNLSGNGNNLYIDNVNVTGVLNPPTPQFSASATTVCAGDAVTFTNATTGVTGTYSWTINGGTPSTSTSTNPVATFSTPGTYSITLAATNSGGTNTVTKTNYITVNAFPTVTGSTGGAVCGTSGTTSVSATASAGTISWYDLASGGTLLGTGSAYTTPNLNASAVYYAQAANGSCVSTTRTAVNASVIPYVTLRSYDCGRTSMDFSEKIYCDVVTGATGYRFEVSDGTNTYEIDRTARYFYLTQIPGNGYNKTYTIRVKAMIGGVYGCYGASCQLMTARPRTNIVAAQCNTVLPVIDTRILAETRPDATGYRFKVLRNGANAQIIDKADNAFRLTELPSYNYNTTYTVYAAYEADGIWGLYGAGCDVTTPAIPALTQIQASQCGATLADPTEKITANNIYLANRYRFEVSQGGNTQVIERTARYFYITQYSGWTINTPYSIRVASEVNGSWGAYGPACTVTSPSTAIMVNGSVSEMNYDLMSDAELGVYPNPNSGNFMISSSEAGSFMILNELGQIIQRVEITKENNFESRVEGLQSGVYFVTGTINNEVMTKKVFVFK